RRRLGDPGQRVRGAQVPQRAPARVHRRSAVDGEGRAPRSALSISCSIARMRPRFAPLALALLAFACGPRVEGSGVAKTEARSVDAFTQVETSAGIHVEVRVGGAASVKVSGDDNIVPLVETGVSGGRLHVGYKSAQNVSTKTPLQVEVVAPSL